MVKSCFVRKLCCIISYVGNVVVAHLYRCLKCGFTRCFFFFHMLRDCILLWCNFVLFLYCLFSMLFACLVIFFFRYFPVRVMYVSYFSVFWSLLFYHVICVFGYFSLFSRILFFRVLVFTLLSCYLPIWLFSRYFPVSGICVYFSVFWSLLLLSCYFHIWLLFSVVFLEVLCGYPIFRVLVLTLLSCCLRIWLFSRYFPVSVMYVSNVSVFTLFYYVLECRCMFMRCECACVFTLFLCH